MPSTGLENIIDSIRCESEERIKRLWADFESKKNALVEETARYIKQFEEKNVHDVLEKMKKQEEKTESLAAMKYRNGVLKAKLNIANRVLESAKKYILELPDDQYFDLVLKICKPHFSKSKSAKLILSKEDFNRLSSKMKEKFLARAKESGMDLTIFESESVQRFGGAKLDFSDVEENCTLDAVFDEHRDELLSFLLDFLFTEKQADSNFKKKIFNVEAPENFGSESFGSVGTDFVPEGLGSLSEKKGPALSGATKSNRGLSENSLSSEEISGKGDVSNGFSAKAGVLADFKRKAEEKGRASQFAGRPVKAVAGAKDSKVSEIDSKEEVDSKVFDPVNGAEVSFDFKKGSGSVKASEKSRAGDFVLKNEVLPGFEQQEEKKGRGAPRGCADRSAKASKAEDLKAAPKLGSDKNIDSKDFGSLNSTESSFESKKSSGKGGTPKRAIKGGLALKNEIIPGFERQNGEERKNSQRIGRSVKTFKAKDSEASRFGSKEREGSKNLESLNKTKNSFNSEKSLGGVGTPKKSIEGDLAPKNEMNTGFERKGKENSGTPRRRAGRSAKDSKAEDLKAAPKFGSEEGVSTEVFDSANTSQGDLSGQSDLMGKSLSRGKTVVYKEKEESAPKKKTSAKIGSTPRVSSSKRAKKVENVNKNNDSEEF